MELMLYHDFMKFRETRTRSVTKAVVYRLCNMALDSVAIFLLTHKVEVTAGILLLTNFNSTLLYFTSERAWNRIQWGRRR